MWPAFLRDIASRAIPVPENSSIKVPTLPHNLRLKILNRRCFAMAVHFSGDFQLYQNATVVAYKRKFTASHKINA
jgi:hypothetical protein